MHSTQSQQITSRHNELFHGPLWRHKQTQRQSLPPFLIRQGLKNIKALFTSLLLELQKWNFGQLLHDSGPLCSGVNTDRLVMTNAVAICLFCAGGSVFCSNTDFNTHRSRIWPSVTLTRVKLLGAKSDY